MDQQLNVPAHLLIWCPRHPLISLYTEFGFAAAASPLSIKSEVEETVLAFNLTLT